jgi:hypothetical protein
MPRRLELLLTAAATALALAFFVSVPYWPKQDSPNALRLPTSEPAAAVSFATPAPRGPSVLASVKPAPNFNLDLPADVATVAARRGYNGETGLIPTMASITTFRLLATGDLISVGPILEAEAVRAPATLTDPVYRVHGQYAVASVDRGVNQLRWTENGITYQVASRTLDASGLTEVANKLR